MIDVDDGERQVNKDEVSEEYVMGRISCVRIP